MIIGDVYGHTLLAHAAVSLHRVLTGFALAAIAAFVLGLLSGLSEAFNAALRPAIEATRPIPPIAWIPIALAIFRFGLASYAFIIFLGAFFPMFSNTIAGVKRTSPVLVDVAKSFGASKLQTTLKVVIPSALPEVVTGMRVGFGIAWMCIIAAEMIGVIRALGLGYFVLTMYELGLYPEMVAGMAMIGIIGYLTNEAFKRLERSLFKWRAEVSL